MEPLIIICHVIYCQCHSADDRCAQIQQVRHADVSTVIASVGTRVTYSCVTGYEFPRGERVMTIKCLRSDQTWNRQVPDCQRK